MTDPTLTSPPPPPSPPNPMPGDVVTVAEPATHRGKKIHRGESAPRGSESAPPPVIPPAPAFDVSSILSSLRDLPLESLSYEDCGHLLNAFSAASTSVAQTRRERQEQLQAAEHIAICYNPNCRRKIDISKSGGFQIRTERDEHHQPVNRFYCSQNCLLYGTAPSHARQTPKTKTGVTA
jgi:hypothetical protein